MSGTNLAMIHASPAAIAPLVNYYARAEPGWTILNLLDDGIMRQFRAGDEAAVEAGLLSLIDRAVTRYHAEAALVTCSATTLDMMRRLELASPVAVVKIDLPMAQAAVAAGRRIGALVTFPPTVGPTTALLEEVARRAGRGVSVMAELRAPALDALLAGDAATHDAILREGAIALRDAGAEAIVLAQVSMAHMRAALEEELGVPVFSSLETSHQALCEALRQ
ncbi:MAG: hypothetical protein HXY18_01000 [Bryobacteraceae bacterium]|nr:hypothetical protein [Bryobacteraceae bacterium]